MVLLHDGIFNKYINFFILLDTQIFDNFAVFSNPVAPLRNASFPNQVTIALDFRILINILTF